jgi:hypothetical protein
MNAEKISDCSIFNWKQEESKDTLMKTEPCSTGSSSTESAGLDISPVLIPDFHLPSGSLSCDSAQLVYSETEINGL